MNPNPRRENLKSWKKGQSGNPKGQPKKIPGIDKLLSDISDADYARVIRALFTKAKKGDVRAAEVLFDRAYGRPKEKVEIIGSVKSYRIVPASGRKRDSGE